MIIKVASNVSMSTQVSSWSWSEKSESSSWTKPSASGGALGADEHRREAVVGSTLVPAQNLFDHVALRRFDKGHRTSTFGARQEVDLVNPLDKHRPTLAVAT